MGLEAGQRRAAPAPSPATPPSRLAHQLCMSTALVIHHISLRVLREVSNMTQKSCCRAANKHHGQPSATKKAEARADTDEALTGTTRWLSSSLRTTRCAARSAWDILGQLSSREARRSVRQTRKVDCAVANARLWSPALDHFPAEQTSLECYGASRRRSLDLGKPRVSNGPAPQHCAHVLYSVLWLSKEPALLRSSIRHTLHMLASARCYDMSAAP